jgi:hypothetical protein
MVAQTRLHIMLYAQRLSYYLSDLKTQSVPHSKHSPSVIKADQLMLYTELIAVCSQIHTKHMQTQSVPRSKHSLPRL